MFEECHPTDRKPNSVRTADPTRLGRIELIDPAFPADFARAPAGRPLQLVVVGGDLAIIAEDQIFAVDLKTEKMRVTWTRK